jgi:hypothetical protein
VVTVGDVVGFMGGATGACAPTCSKRTRYSCGIALVKVLDVNVLRWFIVLCATRSTRSGNDIAICKYHCAYIFVKRPSCTISEQAYLFNRAIIFNSIGKDCSRKGHEQHDYVNEGSHCIVDCWCAVVDRQYYL